MIEIDISKNQKIAIFAIVFALSFGTLFSSNGYVKIAGLVVMAALLIALGILNFIALNGGKKTL